MNDYDIYKHNHPVTPPQVENIFDLGYLGVEKDFPTVKSVVLPIRKRRNNMLSYEETTYNKKHSQLRRIIIEHTICRLRKFGIMGTRFRNRVTKYDHASDIVSGLLNFRIMKFNRMSL
jgi:hypothetical protein